MGDAWDFGAGSAATAGGAAGIELFFAFFGYKIWIYVDNVLTLWLKGNEAVGLCQPCLSRYIHRAPSSVYIIQPHNRAVAIGRLEKVLLSLSSNAKFGNFSFHEDN